MTDRDILLDSAPLAIVRRIDIGLEGSWSDTVSTVWTRGSDTVTFERVPAENREFRHALELYYDGGWIGVHCWRQHADGFHFDERFARAVIERVAAAQAK